MLVGRTIAGRGPRCVIYISEKMEVDSLSWWWVRVSGLVRTRTALVFMLLATSVFVAPATVQASAGSNTDPANQSTSSSDVVLNGISSSASVYGPDCNVTKSQYIGLGGSQDWSTANGLLVYSALDSKGIFQIYTSQPDGTRCHVSHLLVRPGRTTPKSK